MTTEHDAAPAVSDEAKRPLVHEITTANAVGWIFAKLAQMPWAERRGLMAAIYKRQSALAAQETPHVQP